MKFFFPDSSDHVDPTFDFIAETRSRTRVRQRDDLYAHEVLHHSPYDGLLISKSIVERGTSRYTESQRQRLFRQGAPGFFRTKMPIMGDCGAFSYVNEVDPPFSVDEVLHFYTECRVNYGISVDHLILQYDPSWDQQGTFDFSDALAEVQRRQAITLQRAEEFLRTHKARKLKFTPLGVAQGWSPKSYATMVLELQKIGYKYIAIGGLVPLKTHQILSILEKVSEARRPGTRFHLLGVTRCEMIHQFVGFGVVSFDSTSPLRQAFKDMKDNYYTIDGTFPAIRVPQVDANLTLKRRIGAGLVAQAEATKLERGCLKALLQYEQDSSNIEEVISLLRQYEQLYDPKSNRVEDYNKVLLAKPWKDCDCDVCRVLGIHVILFRGAERNRRRGFHNLWVFRKRLDQLLGNRVSEQISDRPKGAGVAAKTNSLRT